MGELSPEFCKDYQEIRMQETVNKLDVGSMPTSMWVTLEDDLVDSCKPQHHCVVGITVIIFRNYLFFLQRCNQKAVKTICRR
jgi:DNA replicative helicase MCM subunit Mcm2 (Cdc46/Mcm family)